MIMNLFYGLSLNSPELVERSLGASSWAAHFAFSDAIALDFV